MRVVGGVVSGKSSGSVNKIRLGRDTHSSQKMFVAFDIDNVVRMGRNK